MLVIIELMLQGTLPVLVLVVPGLLLLHVVVLVVVVAVVVDNFFWFNCSTFAVEDDVSSYCKP